MTNYLIEAINKKSGEKKTWLFHTEKGATRWVYQLTFYNKEWEKITLTEKEEF